jgi:hypothetical protein
MPPFSVTWDYRCPFARIAHLHLVEGLEAGAEWDVRFVPFSLGQAHVEEGEPSVWDDPDSDSGLLALQVGVVVRDRFPERFSAVHRAIFDARHVHGAHIRDRDVLEKLLADVGVDAAAVLAEVDGGEPLRTVRREHEAAVADADVWGVPTFVVGEHAAFVRLMEGPDGDAARARRTIERVVDLLDGWPELNEFKHTSLRR